MLCGGDHTLQSLPCDLLERWYWTSSKCSWICWECLHCVSVHACCEADAFEHVKEVSIHSCCVKKSAFKIKSRLKKEEKGVELNGITSSWESRRFCNFFSLLSYQFWEWYWSIKCQYNVCLSKITFLFHILEQSNPMGVHLFRLNFPVKTSKRGYLLGHNFSTTFSRSS